MVGVYFEFDSRPLVLAFHLISLFIVSAFFSCHRLLLLFDL